MKSNNSDKEKNTESVKYTPVPEFITCPKCGGEVELWSDEYLTFCHYCGHKIFKKENILH